MKKYLLLIVLSFLFTQEVGATHTKGGWMYYEYLGPGILDPTKLRYRIGLKFYVECGTTVNEPNWNFTFFNGAAPYTFLQNIPITPNSSTQINGCTSTSCYPCLASIPQRCYQISSYEIITELAPSPNGYVISKQRCCRINNISNVPNSSNYGATYTIRIPGFNDGPTAPLNASPQFFFNDTVVVCGDNYFAMDFKATDSDGDSLVYSFVDAYHSGGGGSNPPTADPPPYTTIPYSAPYSGGRPLGPGVTINPATGLITGVAPPVGEYVVCVLVKEYRNGVYIGESRKEIHLKTAPCNPLVANPNFNTVICSGFTVTLTQNSSGNPSGYFWDFDDPASGPNNTSTLANPTHTFTDTGVFNIKLRITVGVSCTDSIIKPLGIYPEFFPGFTTAPLCVSTPVQFTDTTYFRFGNVTAWRWDFGDGTTLDDTSHLQNPVYTYTSAGNFDVELRVTNDKGCTDIYTKSITISDNPLLTLLSADSSYCGLDTLQLGASGAGTFNWTPATNITGANTATPMVYPPTPTWYKATLTNASGCFKSDSVLVTPKFDLTNSITSSTTNICEEDTLQLSGSTNKTNNISWQWSPAASVQNATQQNTNAFPFVTTNYTLTTTWGTNCKATATQNIVVKPLAVANAGADVALCNGQASQVLNATGGDTYKWTPVTGLSNPNIFNPVASPSVTTTYIVEVGVNGCSKTRFDSMIVTVRTLPAISTTNDTIICISDTLQLSTTGTGSFVWTPNYMISNTNIPDPLVSPDVPTTYYVRLTDSFGCYQDDSVFIDVVTTVPVFAGSDTTICLTDSIVLNPTSAALYYQWTPSTYLNFDNIKRPTAVPLGNITYTVTGSIGSCVGQDDITIRVVPYPTANAGPDKSICFGFSTQLSASGGSSYVWSPGTFLNDRFSANPTVTNPTANIQYIVNVRDTFGCPKPVKDTVWVYVAKPVIADAGPRDTTAVLGEPMFLHATGGDSYVWTQSTWLNNPTIQNPVALPQDDVTYTVTATTAQGCVGTDFINIKLYKMDPDLYVPTGFTPNGDAFNSVLRPILLGMRELHYFRVYNRGGQLVYSTTQKNAGWDGRFKGKPQDSGTYVWMAEGINYRGELRHKKGTTVLIR